MSTSAIQHQKIIELTSAELIRLAEKYVPPPHQGGVSGPNAVYGYTTNAGAIIVKRHPCHALLKYAEKKNTAAVYSVFCKPTVIPEEVIKDYFNWLTDRYVSPWRSLLEKQPEITAGNYNITDKSFQYRYGFVFSNLMAVPSNLLMNFLVATRMPVEWPYAIQGWHRLVSEFGCDPALALVFMRSFFGCRTVSDGLERIIGLKHNDESLFKVSTANFYDWPLDNTVRKRYVHNFCHGIVDNPAYPFANSTDTLSAYIRINDVWGPTNATGLKTYLGYLYEKYAESIGSYSEGSKFAASDSIKSLDKWRLTFKEVISLIYVEQERIFKRDARDATRKAA